MTCVQSVVESAASARGMTAAATAKAASLQDAHARVARLTEKMNGMEARCAELGSHLTEEKAARQVFAPTPWPTGLDCTRCAALMMYVQHDDITSDCCRDNLLNQLNTCFQICCADASCRKLCLVRRYSAVQLSAYVASELIFTGIQGLTAGTLRPVGGPGCGGGFPATAAGAAERGGTARHEGTRVAGRLLALQVRERAGAGRPRAQRRRSETAARCGFTPKGAALPAAPEDWVRWLRCLNASMMTGLTTAVCTRSLGNKRGNP